MSTALTATGSSSPSFAAIFSLSRRSTLEDEEVILLCRDCHASNACSPMLRSSKRRNSSTDSLWRSRRGPGRHHCRRRGGSYRDSGTDTKSLSVVSLGAVELLLLSRWNPHDQARCVILPTHTCTPTDLVKCHACSCAVLVRLRAHVRVCVCTCSLGCVPACTRG